MGAQARHRPPSAWHRLHGSWINFDSSATAPASMLRSRAVLGATAVALTAGLLIK